MIHYYVLFMDSGMDVFMIESDDIYLHVSAHGSE